jgi:DNA-binding GntR family transcriptional regulator
LINILKQLITRIKILQSISEEGGNEKEIDNKLAFYKQHSLVEVRGVCYEFGEKASYVNTYISGKLVTHATGQKETFKEAVVLHNTREGWFFTQAKPVTPPP